MLTLYLSLSLLCNGIGKADCIPVATGTRLNPTPIGEYSLTRWDVPPGKQAVYGASWFELTAINGTKAFKDAGIHARFNFVPGRLSHGCIRVDKKNIPWLEAINPTLLKIVK